MTKDEIIEMAESCGFTRTHEGIVRLWLSNVPNLESFAKLVAVKEREACAEICENYADYDKEIRNDYHAHLIRARGEA
jgi:hypothetical protein